MQAIIVLPPVKVKKGLFRKKNKKGKGKGVLKSQPALVQGLAVVTNSTLAISRPPVDPNAPAPSPPKPSMAATKSTADTSNSDLPASTPSSTDTTFNRTSAPHAKVHALKQESSSAALSLPDFGLTPTPSPAPSLFVKPAAVRALQAAEPPAQNPRHSDEHAGVTADLYLQALSSFDEPAPETQAAVPAPKPQELPAPAPVATLTAPTPIRTRARSGTTVMAKPPSPQLSVKVVPMEPKAAEKEAAPSPKLTPAEPIIAAEVVDKKTVEDEPEVVAIPVEIPVQLEEVKAVEPEVKPIEDLVEDSKTAEEIEEVKPTVSDVVETQAEIEEVEPEVQAVEKVAPEVVESPEDVLDVNPLEQPVFVKRKPSLEVQIHNDELPSLPSSPMSPITPVSPSSPSRPIIRNLSQPPTPNGVRGTHNEGSLQSVRATAQLFAQRLASKGETDPIKPRVPLPKRVQTFTPGGPVFRRPGDVDNKPTSDARRAQTVTN
ncbi:hypothetical protein CYLTODRAFT_442545 [Cylindrobasidium torrendii FP15055 ss-10]|uniref:Uncharacterized protein n=1 Tax=Cylindrobasidium torrendii FP15055 ss-10 TaxID=1314674 RepID=A0A0D7BHK7_9AGAR|nr:hypothetical protein CYLTODRAFT_442545 [Cylindrobasidium torrendii FP15055 ss-10]